MAAEGGLADARLQGPTSDVSEALTQIELIVRRIAGGGRVGPSTSPYHDLGISGDDALEMLEEIASRLNVSFEDFKLDRYFPQEVESFGEHLGRLLGRRPKRKRLTLQHLASVAERGSWFDPMPMSRLGSGVEMSVVPERRRSAQFA